MGSFNSITVDRLVLLGSKGEAAQAPASEDGGDGLPGDETNEGGIPF